MATLGRELGLPEAVDISRSHVNAKGDFRGEDELVLTPELSEAIRRDFWREIEHFGYEAPRTSAGVTR